MASRGGLFCMIQVPWPCINIPYGSVHTQAAGPTRWADALAHVARANSSSLSCSMITAILTLGRLSYCQNAVHQPAIPVRGVGLVSVEARRCGGGTKCTTVTCSGGAYEGDSLECVLSTDASLCLFFFFFHRWRSVVGNSNFLFCPCFADLSRRKASPESVHNHAQNAHLTFGNAPFSSNFQPHLHASLLGENRIRVSHSHRNHIASRRFSENATGDKQQIGMAHRQQRRHVEKGSRCDSNRGVQWKQTEQKE
jgi:hypothetical protein